MQAVLELGAAPWCRTRGSAQRDGPAQQHIGAPGRGDGEALRVGGAGAGLCV